MVSNDKANNIIVHGHRPTGELDRSKPPLGGSVVTKQLKAIREAKGGASGSFYSQEKRGKKK